MNRGKFTICRETGKLVPYGKPKSVEAHGVIADEICLKSMVDGRIYTSKAELRKHYQRAGVTEIGNEINFTPKRENPYETEQYRKQMEQDCAETWYALRDGMFPMDEFARERCKIMDKTQENYNYDRRRRDSTGRPLD